MPVLQDTEERWRVEFPGERARPYSAPDVVDHGPWVTVLQDRKKTTYKRAVLSVEYGANNPVTITWRADGKVMKKMEDRIRQSSTSIRLYKRWLMKHPNSTYTVTVEDQEIGRIHSVNPISSSCTVSIYLDY